MTRSAWLLGYRPGDRIRWPIRALRLPRSSEARRSPIGRSKAPISPNAAGRFIIIALGESLLVTGATFSGLPWTVPVIAAMVAAFGAAVAMWWVYFDVTAEAATERIAHSEEPGGLARLAYTYFHLPMVAGIIVAAVGDEIVLAHPRGGADLSTALAIVGGPALFLVGYSLFKRAVLGRFFAVHLVALAALIALFLSRPARISGRPHYRDHACAGCAGRPQPQAHRAGTLFQLEFELACPLDPQPVAQLHECRFRDFQGREPHGHGARYPARFPAPETPPSSR